MRGAEKAGENRAMLSSTNVSWGTPKDLFDKLNEEFHFSLDAAASDKNHKCKKYYTEETDGLSHSWRGETVFLNPPYGKAIGLWMKKALDENREGATIVALVPSRTSTRWFHDYVYGKAELRFIKGRLKYTDEDGNAKDPAPFDSMIVIYRGANAR